MKKIIALTVAIILCSFSNIVAAETNYKKYQNGSFSYEILYPESILFPKKESGGGDGREFISRDKKVAMLAYGSHNFDAPEFTPKSMYDDELKNTSGLHQNRIITYKKFANTWYVISGTEGDKVFYTKVLFRILKDDVQAITFHIEYPQSNKAVYDPITSSIAKSLHLL